MDEPLPAGERALCGAMVGLPAERQRTKRSRRIVESAIPPQSPLPILRSPPIHRSTTKSNARTIELFCSRTAERSSRKAAGVTIRVAKCIEILERHGQQPQVALAAGQGVLEARRGPEAEGAGGEDPDPRNVMGGDLRPVLPNARPVAFGLRSLVLHGAPQETGEWRLSTAARGRAGRAPCGRCGRSGKGSDTQHLLRRLLGGADRHSHLLPTACWILIP